MLMETCLQVAGALQLTQVPLMSIAARKLGWHTELAQLSRVNQRLFGAIGLGIVIYVMGTGVIAIAYAHALATTELGAALCVLQAVAWSTRVGQQLLRIRTLMPAGARPFSRLATTVYATLGLIYSVVAVWHLFAPPTRG